MQFVIDLETTPNNRKATKPTILSHLPPVMSSIIATKKNQLDHPQSSKTMKAKARKINFSGHANLLVPAERVRRA